MSNQNLYVGREDYICNLVVELGRRGYSMIQISSALGIGRATIRRWMDQYERFRDAMDLAMTHSQAWWESAAQNGHADSVIGARVWTKSVASRFREDYADRQEVTGAGGTPLAMTVTRTIVDPKEDAKSMEDDASEVSP